MKIIRDIKKMFQLSQKIRRRGHAIGFVPTMGALHKGHLSLIRAAVKENDFVVVSIFVNPTQFGPQEDFKIYPRNLKRDAQMCKASGVDIIFSPDAKDMYPVGYKTFVTAENLSKVLCGKSRPGHFRGVTTVVTKLFNIVNPSVVYLGQKDAQQAIIIKKIVEDLNIPAKIKVMPTVRQKDGLALSSRNAHLSKKEREEAIVCYQALNLARDLVRDGIRDAHKIIQKMNQLIRSKKRAAIDYISIVDSINLKPLSFIKGKALAAVAIRFGKTRLIDNIIINA